MSVIDVYAQIAIHFDKTRHSIWPCVRTFLDSVPNKPTVQLLEAGVGNGKNLVYAASIGFKDAAGFDACEAFVDLCHQRRLANVWQQNILTPAPQQYDVILCIAVIHHLPTAAERKQALKNLCDALKPGGKLLLTVWSFEHYGLTKARRFTAAGDNQVPWRNAPSRYYYIYSKDEFAEFVGSTGLEVEIKWEAQNWVAILSKP